VGRSLATNFPLLYYQRIQSGNFPCSTSVLKKLSSVEIRPTLGQFKYKRQVANGLVYCTQCTMYRGSPMSNNWNGYGKEILHKSNLLFGKITRLREIQSPGPTTQDAETPSHSGFHPPHLLYNRGGLTRNNSEFRRPEMWAQIAGRIFNPDPYYYCVRTRAPYENWLIKICRNWLEMKLSNFYLCFHALDIKALLLGIGLDEL
jgi:hypothetical protein